MLRRPCGTGVSLATGDPARLEKPRAVLGYSQTSLRDLGLGSSCSFGVCLVRRRRGLRQRLPVPQGRPKVAQERFAAFANLSWVRQSRTNRVPQGRLSFRALRDLPLPSANGERRYVDAALQGRPLPVILTVGWTLQRPKPEGPKDEKRPDTVGAHFSTSLILPAQQCFVKTKFSTQLRCCDIRLGLRN
jgi:hypothetical protein